MITGARGIKSQKTLVLLEIQMLAGNGLPFGRPFLERCAVEPPGADISLLSGMGVRSGYWAGFSPDVLGQLSIATTKAGLYSIL